VRFIESQGSVIRDTSDEVSHVVVVSRDVTERRRTEEQMREQGGFTTSDDDTTFGGYAHLGAFWRVPGGFSVGVDGRIATTSDLELFGVDTDADYSQIALTLGWSR
jgi:hypothetical protein